MAWGNLHGCAALWVPADSLGRTWAVSLAFSSTCFTSLPSRCRKADAAVDMDEMVAAMVLTSLSCSPVVQSPPAGESGIPRECAFGNIPFLEKTQHLKQKEIWRNALCPLDLSAGAFARCRGAK